MTSDYLALQKLLVTGRHPSHPVAVSLAGDELRWQEWQTLVTRLRQSIQDFGTGAWGIYCEDTAHAGAALFALWHTDSIAWLPGNKTPDTLQALSEHVVGWISDVELPTDKPVINIAALAVDTLFAVETVFAIDTLKEQHVAVANNEWAPLSDNDILLYVFTSGSSGEPKAIAKNLSQIQAELDNLQALWGRTLHDTTLMASVSHQHFYGLLFRLLLPLSNGCRFVRDTIQYPEQWFATTQQMHPVSWVASPALYKRMQPLLPWSALREHIAIMFCSGGKLPEENAAFLAAQLQQPVVEVFGSSETGGVGWRRAEGGNTPWTCFNGVTVTRSEEGALVIQSPYLPDNAAYQMGDSVDVLANNQLGDHQFALGARLDRIVKIEEKRVSLPQLEQHLCTHPWVKEAHVLPLAIQGRQSLGAVVVLTPDVASAALATRKQLTDALREHMAHAYEAVTLPKKWRFVTEMPLNAQGKRTQQQMAEFFETPARVLLPEMLCINPVSTHETHLTLAIPAKLTYFEGHFTKAAILPGVVQIDWAWLLAQHFWSLPDAFSDIEVLKFQRVITPLQIVHLSLRFDTVKRKLYFQFQSSKGTHSSGRIVLKSDLSKNNDHGNTVAPVNARTTGV